MLEDLVDTRQDKKDLQRALMKISELEHKLTQAKLEYDYLKREHKTVINANVRLVDTIKQYNPRHFGNGEGRHDSEIIDKASYYVI